MAVGHLDDMKKAVAIIQVRTTSSRLRNKALLCLNGKTLIENVIHQAKQISEANEVWVATSTETEDDIIAILCEELSIKCYRGSLQDVRSRFIEIAELSQAEIILRITGDNPLTNPHYGNQLIKYLKNHPEVDYVRMDKSAIIDGTGSEAFHTKAFLESVNRYSDITSIEHVTTPFLMNEKRIHQVQPSENMRAEGKLFVGIDTMEDYRNARKLFKKLGSNPELNSIIKFLKNEKTI